MLQRIAVVYPLAATAYLFLRKGTRWWLAGFLLVTYWALLELVPVPGFGAGDLSREGNLPADVDRLLLSGHLWQDTWDPEGLPSTLPAVSTTLLGISTGEWLRSDRSSNEKTIGLFVAGAAAVVLGWAWNPLFPINKNLWTSSYVLFTAGVAFQGLAPCYWTIDVRRWTRWAEAFVVYGMNALAVFVASGLVAKSMALVRVPRGESWTSVTGWLYETAFASWAGPLNGSLAFAVSYVLLWWWLMWLLHRRGVHIKI